LGSHPFPTKKIRKKLAQPSNVDTFISAALRPFTSTTHPPSLLWHYNEGLLLNQPPPGEQNRCLAGHRQQDNASLLGTYYATVFGTIDRAFDQGTLDSLAPPLPAINNNSDILVQFCKIAHPQQAHASNSVSFLVALHTQQPKNTPRLQHHICHSQRTIADTTTTYLLPQEESPESFLMNPGCTATKTVKPQAHTKCLRNNPLNFNTSSYSKKNTLCLWLQTQNKNFAMTFLIMASTHYGLFSYLQGCLSSLVHFPFQNRSPPGYRNTFGPSFCPMDYNNLLSNFCSRDIKHISPANRQLPLLPPPNITYLVGDGLSHAWR
jgi:hypothetical protein